MAEVLALCKERRASSQRFSKSQMITSPRSCEQMRILKGATLWDRSAAVDCRSFLRRATPRRHIQHTLQASFSAASKPIFGKDIAFLQHVFRSTRFTHLTAPPLFFSQAILKINKTFYALKEQCRKDQASSNAWP